MVDDDTADADAQPELTLDLLSEVGGSVRMDELPELRGAASADAAGGTRAAVYSTRRAMLSRFLGENNIAKPVVTPAEVQLVDGLIAKHDALNCDAETAASAILEAYTRELLARRGDPACQLRKKV